MHTTARLALAAALGAGSVVGALTVVDLAGAQVRPAVSTQTTPEAEPGAAADPPSGPLCHGPGHGRPGGGPGMGAWSGELFDEVAAELGIDADELEAAFRTVGERHFLERLDDAVESGRMTEEEADELRQAADDGNLGEVLEQRRADRRAEREQRWAERRAEIEERGGPLADRLAECDAAKADEATDEPADDAAEEPGEASG